MSFLDKARGLFGKPWHPTQRPQVDGRFWQGWDGHDELVAPRYLIYPYAMLEAVPDGDAMYGLQLQGRWSEAALTGLRVDLDRLLPKRSLILPHKKGLCTVLVYCSVAPRSRFGASVEFQDAALRPAARCLAAVIRAALVTNGGPEATLEGDAVPGSQEDFERFIALVEREVKFGNPLLGIGKMGDAPGPNYFNPVVSDYPHDVDDHDQGWTKWRHGWGRDLFDPPASHLRDHFVGAERAAGVLRALMSM